VKAESVAEEFPNGYFSIDKGRNLYKLFTTEMSWRSARDFCTDTENANLVSIRDGFEQAYLFLLVNSMSSSPWIGLINKTQSVGPEWSDKWTFNYNNMNTSDSSASLDLNQTCAYIDSTTGKWNADSCSTNRTFICKKTEETLQDKIYQDIKLEKVEDMEYDDFKCK
jgi:hypothetical protein